MSFSKHSSLKLNFPSVPEKFFKQWNCPIWCLTSGRLTCVSCQRCRWDDGLILAEVRALPHVVFEGALGLVAMQGSGVVFRVKAVIGWYPLQAAEWGLAAPRLGQSVAAFKAIDALEGVLATELTWKDIGTMGKKDLLLRTTVNFTTLGDFKAI